MNIQTQLHLIRTAASAVRSKVIRSAVLPRLFSSFGMGPCRVPTPVPVPVPLPRPRTGTQGIRSALNALVVGMVAFGLTSAAAVHAQTRDFQADGRLVDVGIKVAGRTAPLFINGRDWSRYYFQAFEGQNYSLVIRNNTGRRIGVLIAVDGLNVVNGEKTRLSSGEPMYVLSPWSSAEIAGWRTSLSSIRKFVFVDEERSYAERTGQANGDMGWVRVLAFDENVPQQSPDIRLKNERERRDLGDGARGSAPEPQSAAPRSPSDNDRKAQAFGGQEAFPGTGWGDKGWDPVQRTQFVAKRAATDHLVFRYEYASGLQALGIFPPRGRDRLDERENGQLGFAKPPKW